MVIFISHFVLSDLCIIHHPTAAPIFSQYTFVT